MGKTLLLLLAAAVVSSAEELPPPCDRPVYCNSKVLHHMQLAQIFTDSKTFVDLHMINDENKTLSDFDTLLVETNDNPSKEELKSFLDKYFDHPKELDNWSPPDYSDDPKFLHGIRDEALRQYAKDINAIWPSLGRKVTQDVFDSPDKFSLIPVSHGFIIPGGRFKELYYWDTYWIIEGLLISGMKETVRGKIDNLIQLLKKIGHVPNGSRWYYQERSQPPLLTAMMSLYFRETKDVGFLKMHINSLEEEIEYWLDTQVVNFEKNCKEYMLLRYYAPSAGPRPESYFEDYTNAKSFDNEDRKTEFYIDMKSAAESGWDFSTRWFVNTNGDNTGNLTTINTRVIVPVDLNSMFANALQNMAYFQAVLHNPRKGAHWAYLARQWRSSIEEVLWDEKDGIWYDYNIEAGEHRKYFYGSNVAPLWMGVVDKALVKKHAPRVTQYLRTSKVLDFPGGVPTSLMRSGEQWDFPNAWPPLVSIMVNALEALGTEEGKSLAFDVAQTWVRACREGFLGSKQMFEKYDAEVPGRVGGGGEYVVQNGFGWSNGVVLEFLAKYGRKMTAADSKTPPLTSIENEKQKDEIDTAQIVTEAEDGDIEIQVLPIKKESEPIA